MNAHACLATSAALIGALVEFTFIATFMQCFFAC
jgi:hypothetical protein